jgi:predicted signal transduction protein with EAL and GGDEF domain
MINAISEPMSLSSGHQARIGASVGLAVSQDGAVDADRLMMQADLAVYRAKGLGRGRTEVFDQALGEQIERRTALEDAIRAAINDDTVSLSFDPVVELMTGEPIGFETRIACKAASTFLDRPSLVDDLGRNPALVELDTWCLARATALVASLEGSSVSIAVPITLHHLVQDRVITDVEHALTGSGLSGHRLVLILPATGLSDDARLLNNLIRLHERGVQISIEAFGAGTGPTNLWMQLPVTSVRLDPMLLHDAARPILAPAGGGSARSRQLTLPEDTGASVGEPVAAQLLRLTVQTAHAFGYRVIARQIDDAATLVAASTAGCDLGVGVAVAELLADHSVEYGPLRVSVVQESPRPLLDP